MLSSKEPLLAREPQVADSCCMHPTNSRKYDSGKVIYHLRTFL